MEQSRTETVLQVEGLGSPTVVTRRNLSIVETGTSSIRLPPQRASGPRVEGKRACGSQLQTHKGRAVVPRSGSPTARAPWSGAAVKWIPNETGGLSHVRTVTGMHSPPQIGDERSVQGYRSKDAALLQSCAVPPTGQVDTARIVHRRPVRTTMVEIGPRHSGRTGPPGPCWE